MRSSTRSTTQEAPRNALIPMVVPFYFHLFFLTMFFVANIAVHQPALVGISLGMLTLSFALHGVLVRRHATLSQLALSSEPSSVK